MAKGTINKVTLIGRLGANPEVRYMPNGTAVANLRLATNDGYRDKQSGQFVESTEWHRVVLFGRLAEIAGQYCQKGRLLYIEGRIRTNKWQDQSGQDRYTTEIVANELQLLGGQGEGGSRGADASFDQSQPEFAKQQPAPQPAPQAKGKPAEQPAMADSFDDDDIPF